jgi:hypothetical protein
MGQQYRVIHVGTSYTGSIALRQILRSPHLAVEVRWPVWTTIGTLVAGTIPLLCVILVHFRTKQVNEKFDL